MAASRLRRYHGPPGMHSPIMLRWQLLIKIRLIGDRL